jgi:hypothetical protein
MQRQVSGRALSISAGIVAILVAIAMVATVSGRAPVQKPGGGGGPPALLSGVSSRLG